MIDQGTTAGVSSTVYTSSTVDGAAIEAVKARLRGELLRPGEEGYDHARTIWNGMIDRRPALIARCAGAADVLQAINFARAHDLPVSVRGGDHSPAGHAVCDGGLMIDLSLMAGIEVDPVARTARVEPGLRWGEVDQETQRYGLATTGGTIADTGVAGLALGGGLGWLAGRYGLTCDNLLAAEIVTADGELLRASATENPDLFWALRGGGGNFGVVTAFEFQLHEVGPTVIGGMVAHPLEQAGEVLRFYRDFCASNPDEVNTICAFLTTPEGLKVVAIAACHCGSLEGGERVLRPLKEFGPPVLDQIGPLPYVALQSALDSSFPRGRRYYAKSTFIQELNDGLIERMAEQFATVPSPHTVFLLQQLGNAASRVAPDATAFAHRDAHWDAVVFSGWDNPAQDAEQIAWSRRVYGSWRPFSTGGLYSNVGAENEGEVRSAYGAAYERLAEIKARYDRNNFFRLNTNVKPSTTMSAQEHKDLVREYAEEVWSLGRIEATDKYVASDYLRHDPGVPFEVRGPEGIKQLVSMYRGAFPDIHLSADDVIAEGDRVVVRWGVTGTHRGELMGVAPTGREVNVAAVEVFRLSDGKIAEQWVLVDNLGLLQQLGAFPLPVQAGS